MEELIICPRCNHTLERVQGTSYYYMCYHCVEGWTWEELLGIFKYKKILKEKAT